MAAYSAFGVTSDGFVKPDLVAPGHKIVGLLASDDTNLAQNYPDYKVTSATNYLPFQKTLTPPGGVSEFMVWVSRTSSTSFCYFDQISLETR